MPSDKKFDLEGFSVSSTGDVESQGTVTTTQVKSNFGIGQTEGESLAFLVGANSEMNIVSPVITIFPLPTSDPGKANQLWNDGGILKISG